MPGSFLYTATFQILKSGRSSFVTHPKSANKPALNWPAHFTQLATILTQIRHNRTFASEAPAKISSHLSKFTLCSLNAIWNYAIKTMRRQLWSLMNYLRTVEPQRLKIWEGIQAAESRERTGTNATMLQMCYLFFANCWKCKIQKANTELKGPTERSRLHNLPSSS